MAQFPGIYRSPYGDSIAALLVRQGDIAARGADERGQIWQQAIGQLGQIGAGAVGEYQAQKDQKKREAGISQALGSWDGQDIQSLHRALVPYAGIEGTARLINGVVAFRELGEKQDEQEQKRLGVTLGAAELLPDTVLAQVYPALRAKAAKIGMPVDEWPEQYSPELKPALARYGQLFRGEKPTKTNLQHVTTDKGIQLLNPGTGELSAPIAQPPPKAKAYQPVTTASGIQSFDPTSGTLGGVIAQPPPKAKAAPNSGSDDIGRVVAEAWASGSAFPQTQAATTAALTYMDQHPEQFPNLPRKLGEKERQEVTGATSTLATIEDVLAAYEKVKDRIGPVNYTFNEITRQLPGTDSDPDFVTFNTLLRGMGNLEIKRITGAQMSEAEADRLLKGMATGTLKPKDFEAAIAVMKRNAKRDRDVRLYGKVIDDASEGPAMKWDAEMAGGSIKIRVVKR